MEATTVAAQGQAEAPFNLAHFSLQLSCVDVTVAQAKTRLGKAVGLLTATVDDMGPELGVQVVKNSVRSNSHVAEKREWVENVSEFVGYEISYTYSFDVSNLDVVNEVYDTLLSLHTTDEVHLTVNTPSFSLKGANRERLNKRALKQAFQRVTDRFAAECQVLGLEPANFEIATWEANYSDSQRSPGVARALSARSAGASRGLAPKDDGSAMAFSAESVESDAGGGGPVISLNTGLASVTVNLEVAFQRRS